jgi:GntR family transcriptional regulator, trigonelline degradation regulator
VSDSLPALNIEKLAAPLRQRVEGVLREAVVSGLLAPGRRLTERELTQMTGVSRTLVREALRQLEAEGLVTVIPNKGPVVRELTGREARELYEIRAVLEGLAARRFALNADHVAMQRLRSAVAAASNAYAQEKLSQALAFHNEFYDVLFSGSGSETLRSMLATLHARILRWRALGLAHPKRSPNRSREAAAGLKRILAAVEARDPERAERETRQHAERGAAEVMRLLGDTRQDVTFRRRRV